MRRHFLGLCLIALSVALVAPRVRAQSAPPERIGQLPAPLPLFPADNWWNQDISAAPVDPRSAQFIGFVGATRRLHPDFGGYESPGSANIYGFPYFDGIRRPAEEDGAVLLRRRKRRRRSRDRAQLSVLSDSRRSDHAAVLDRRRSGRQPGSRRRSAHADRRSRQPRSLRALRRCTGTDRSGRPAPAPRST